MLIVSLEQIYVCSRKLYFIQILYKIHHSCHIKNRSDKLSRRRKGRRGRTQMQTHETGQKLN